MENNRNSLASAIRYALGASLVAGLAATAAPVAAQDQDEDDVADLGRQQVTGSRITRTDLEGPSPVTIITREDLELSGESNLADVLRQQNFNSFGSFNERSGSTGQSQATLSLRGLGSARTLILIDGRRVPTSPVLGATAVDLNTLPLAAVERVEILTDSASAVYGSDALGGVVNIILRKDFTGGEISAGLERPTRNGRDTETGSFIIGGSNDRGRFLFTAEVVRRDPIFDRDRPWSRAFDPGTGDLGDTRGISEFGNTIIPLAPLPGTGTQRLAAPDCPTDVYAGTFTTPRGTACGYAYANESMLTASLNRQSTYLTADYELSSDHTLYFQQYFTRNSSDGRYAPPVGITPVIAADNPINPVGVDILLGHRFASLGNRDTNQTNYFFDTLLGVEGLFGSINYDWNVRYNRYESNETGNTFALASVFSEEVASGGYNPFDPFSPDNAEAIRNMSHTVTRDIGGSYWDTSLVLSGDAFELGSGFVQWAAGAEYRDESFDDLSDAQSVAGNVIGSAGGNAGGERDAFAFFTEWLIPLHQTLELTAAVRYDEYSIGGDATSPQLALKYTPFDNLLLRASWGEGFRAPDLNALFAAPAQSFEFTQDFVACDAAGIPDSSCPVFQEETFFLSNTDLQPEQSESFNLGVVWEPLTGLSLTADVYQTEIEDVITSPSTQALVNLERQGLSLPIGSRIVRDANGIIDFIESTNSNIAVIEVRGFDAAIDFTTNTDNLGTFGANLAFSRIWQYDQQITPVDPVVNIISRNGQPANRASWSLTWAYGDFDVGYTGYWISDVAAGTTGSDPEGTIELTGKIPSYVQHNAQVSWFAPWNGEIRVGVRNIADRGPSLNSFTQDLSRGNQSLYPVEGRVPYFSYTQRF